MPKEPYNLFAGAGSTLPGGSMYEDLLFIVKAMVHVNGGVVEIPEDVLMYVDRDEMLRCDDIFKDGVNHKVFSIQTKERNQNPEGCVTHGEVVDDVPPPLAVRIIGTAIWLCVIFAVVFLVWQLVRAMFF